MTISPLTDNALIAAGIRHGFFTRQGGVSRGIYDGLNCGLGSHDDTGHVRANRASVAAAMGVAAEALATPYQVHGTAVAVVSAPLGESERPRADALVTRTPGLAIAVGTADCGPVLFADPEAGVIGVAHAGWRGALDGVLAATVQAMVSLGARQSRILAALGPTISQPSYEVGEDFALRFRQTGQQIDRYFKPAERPAHYLFDLPGFICDRLAELGLAAVNDLSLCTYRDPQRFFSYRRATHRGEPDYGRMLSAIALPSPGQRAR